MLCLVSKQYLWWCRSDNFKPTIQELLKISSLGLWVSRLSSTSSTVRTFVENANGGAVKTIRYHRDAFTECLWDGHVEQLQEAPFLCKLCVLALYSRHV